MRALSIVVLIGGCERAQDESAATEIPAPKVMIEMRDPGVEPRVALRAHLHAGASQTYVWQRRTKVGQRERVLDLVYNVRVIAAEDDQFHLRDTMLAATSTPPSKTDYDVAIIGTSVDAWRDARGLYLRPSLRRSRFEGSTVSRPELAGAFPEQPVGPGAKWHENIEYDGARASVDVELLSVDHGHVRERLVYISARTTTTGRSVTLSGTASLEFAPDGLSGTAHIVNVELVHGQSGDFRVDETIDGRALVSAE
jgi:hypothetical protein